MSKNRKISLIFTVIMKIFNARKYIEYKYEYVTSDMEYVLLSTVVPGRGAAACWQKTNM